MRLGESSRSLSTTRTPRSGSSFRSLSIRSPNVFISPRTPTPATRIDVGWTRSSPSRVSETAPTIENGILSALRKIPFWMMRSGSMVIWSFSSGEAGYAKTCLFNRPARLSADIAISAERIFR